MNREVRRQFTNQLADTHVLHDGGIDTGADNRAQKAFRIFELVGEHQCVERHIATHPALVQVGHEVGQVGLGEILATHAGIETIEPKEDRIGTIFDGRTRAFPISRRRKDFRFVEGGVR